MPKLDLSKTPQTNATGYPAPFDAEVQGRYYRRLAPGAHLTHLAATHVVLEPGAYSSQRHWHRLVDELLIMISGTAVLIEESGQSAVSSGDIIAWPAGAENGHRLYNSGKDPCVYVVVSAGDHAHDSGVYPDIDMIFDPDGFARKDGTRYG